MHKARKCSNNTVVKYTQYKKMAGHKFKFCVRKAKNGDVGVYVARSKLKGLKGEFKISVHNRAGRLLGDSKVECVWPEGVKIAWKGNPAILNNVPARDFEVMIIIEFGDIVWMDGKRTLEETKPETKTFDTTTNNTIVENTATEILPDDNKPYEPNKAEKEMIGEMRRVHSSKEKRETFFSEKGIREMFQDWDQNDDGCLTMDEFTQGFCQHFELDQKLAKLAFTTIDKDNSGEIDISEFKDWLIPIKNLANEA